MSFASRVYPCHYCHVVNIQNISITQKAPFCPSWSLPMAIASPYVLSITSVYLPSLAFLICTVIGSELMVLYTHSPTCKLEIHGEHNCGVCPGLL